MKVSTIEFRTKFQDNLVSKSIYTRVHNCVVFSRESIVPNIWIHKNKKTH